MDLKGRRVLLVGYSGHGNFGDDLLLKQAVDAIERGKAHAISIHTSAPADSSGYLRKWFPRARVVAGRMSFRLLASHDRVLYFGGGVLFEFNRVGWFRYLRRLLSQLRLGALPRLVAGVQFGGIGMGLGPFACDRGRRLAGRRIRDLSLLGVRDRDSLRFALSQGAPHAKLTPDLSLLIADGTQPMCTESPSFRDSPQILVCPRHYPHGARRNRYLEALTGAMGRLRDLFPSSHITVFGFQGRHDEDVLELAGKHGDRSFMWDPMAMTVDDALRLFAAQDLVISSRMHGIFAAGMVGVPSVSIGVDPKLAYASGFFTNSVHVADTASRDDIVDAAKRASLMPRGLPATRHLVPMAEACRQEYRRMTDWLDGKTT